MPKVLILTGDAGESLEVMDPPYQRLLADRGSPANGAQRRVRAARSHLDRNPVRHASPTSWSSAMAARLRPLTSGFPSRRRRWGRSRTRSPARSPILASRRRAR